jgi:dienelactone hydrolase
MKRCSVKRQFPATCTIAHVLIFLIFSFCLFEKNADAATGTSPIWDLSLLMKSPKMKWLKHEDPVCSLEYQGLPYKGKKTRVFAYYATPGSISGNPGSDKNLPGVILIHGGNDHAQVDWVRYWARFGYAALSMDLSGCGSDQKPLPNSIPINDYLNYDLNYHMVANVILAHSLMISFKEVDSNRTAVIGLSVGGQLTCIVAGLDKRFKAAVPVYGCGYLYKNSLFSEKLSQMDKARRNKWIDAFDPSSYLSSVTIPMLFVTGVNDPFYPLDSYQKTYRLVKGPHNLCIIPGLPHAMDIGLNLIEPALFIDQFCRKGVPLASINRPEIVNGNVFAKFQCKTKPTIASLYYTTDTCVFKDRKWEAINAAIHGPTITCKRPPENATAWLITLSDERNAVVSSEVILK